MKCDYCINRIVKDGKTTCRVLGTWVDSVANGIDLGSKLLKCAYQEMEKETMEKETKVEIKKEPAKQYPQKGNKTKKTKKGNKEEVK